MLPIFTLHSSRPDRLRVEIHVHVHVHTEHVHKSVYYANNLANYNMKAAMYGSGQATCPAQTVDQHIVQAIHELNT